VIIIDRRFCGPSESGNGGYACGVAAAQLPGRGAIEVTLRSPPPLEKPIEVERLDDDRAVLRDGAQLVAEVARSTLTIEPPAPVSFDEATLAATRYPFAEQHPFPRCFVCGPARAAGDGLRVFAGAVTGRSVAAAPWIPDASVGDGAPEARVRPEIIWSVLDCPSWFGFACFHSWEGRPLLGRLTAEIHTRPLVGERLVCAGWFLSRDGRKAHVGSALFSDRGELHAIGRATWITVP
jgi:hypothetical protein